MTDDTPFRGTSTRYAHNDRPPVWGSGAAGATGGAQSPSWMSYDITCPPARVGAVNYRYSEDRLLEDIRRYIDGTYAGHYSRNQFQATEFIIDCGHGTGFTLGNVMKYAQRYGKKQGFNRHDLLKIIHYAIIALHIHDQEHEQQHENQ